MVPFLYQPYPWRFWELKRLAILFLGSTTWIILSLLFLFNIKTVFDYRLNKYLLFICLLTLVGFAFGSSQINQAIRHNHKVIPVIIAISSIFLHKYFNRRYTFK